MLLKSLTTFMHYVLCRKHSFIIVYTLILRSNASFYTNCVTKTSYLNTYYYLPQMIV